ncbi:ABC transporter permease [Nocardioides sp. LHD-245]|uniref:ABC transporter permease n=1 Tax=Nocardioides sp. LHD-245 TaxID=3051387 RepID=UPI0027DFAB93|nr:ABC transporter permease [Nocardioides sp. LHD-245]
MQLVVFLLRRLVRLVLSLLVVSMLTFGLLSLAPGSFGGIQAAGAGSTGLASGRTVDLTSQVQQRYGEDVPVWEQYGNWLGPAITGDLGYSYKYPESTVGALIADKLPVSLALALIAMGLALVVAIPIGILAATRRNSAWDHGSMFVVTTATAFPTYLAGILLVLIFCSWLHWLPTGGWAGPKYALLPVLALAIAPAGIMARYVRSSVLEVLREEYVVAAVAKGGSWGVVMRRHVLRNALMPLVTVAGPLLAGLVVGTIFIETIFGVPGIGGLFTQAAQVRDMPLLMGTTLTFALLLMLMNLLVDLSYAVLDPRTRSGLGLSVDPAHRSEDTTGAILEEVKP